MYLSSQSPYLLRLPATFFSNPRCHARFLEKPETFQKNAGLYLWSADSTGFPSKKRNSSGPGRQDHRGEFCHIDKFAAGSGRCPVNEDAELVIFPRFRRDRERAFVIVLLGEVLFAGIGNMGPV